MYSDGGYLLSPSRRSRVMSVQVKLQQCNIAGAILVELRYQHNVLYSLFVFIVHCTSISDGLCHIQIILNNTHQIRQSLKTGEPRHTMNPESSNLRVRYAIGVVQSESHCIVRKDTKDQEIRKSQDRMNLDSRSQIISKTKSSPYSAVPLHGQPWLLESEIWFRKEQ